MPFSTLAPTEMGAGYEPMEVTRHRPLFTRVSIDGGMGSSPYATGGRPALAPVRSLFPVSAGN